MEKKMNRKRQLNETEQLKPLRKALLVTHVSGFVPQFEMNNVRILQELGYEVHYASNFHTPSYGTDNHRLDGNWKVLDTSQPILEEYWRLQYRNMFDKKILY